MATWSDIIKSPKGTVWKFKNYEGAATVRLVRLNENPDVDAVLHWNAGLYSIVDRKWATSCYCPDGWEKTGETFTCEFTFKAPEPVKVTKYNMVEGKVYRNVCGARFSRIGDIMYAGKNSPGQPLSDFVSHPEFILMPDETFTLECKGVFS